MTLRQDILNHRGSDQNERVIAENYHEQRVESVREEGGIYDTEGTSGLVVHVIDSEAFDADAAYRLEHIEEPYKTIPVLSNPFGGSRGRGDELRYTATGPSAVTTDEDDVVRYTHIANNGIVEGVALNIVNSGERSQVDGPYIGALTFEGIVVERTARMLDVVDEAGIEGPYYIVFSLWGVSGVKFIYRQGRGPMLGAYEFGQDTVSPFGIKIESAIGPIELREALSEPLISLWKVAGYDIPQTYSDGEWELKEELGL